MHVCDVRGWVSACLCARLVYQGSMAATRTVCHSSQSDTQTIDNLLDVLVGNPNYLCFICASAQHDLLSSQGLTLALASAVFLLLCSR